MKLYGPTDSWPEHEDKAWNAVLKLAREHGWSFREHSDHSFGKLICPQGECQLATIYSTGRGSESVAQQQGRKILRCHHSEMTTSEIGQANNHVRSAERLITAAFARLNHADLESSYQRIVPEEDEDPDQAWELVGELMAQADDQLRYAESLFADEGADRSTTPAVAADSADRDLTVVAKIMRRLRGSKRTDVAELTAELKEQRRRLKQLRNRIDASGPGRRLT